MAIVYKATSNFQLTTLTTNPQYAVPHTGGWSESFWSQTDPLAVNPAIWIALQRARATLLPAQGAIIGYRVQKYDMDGNALRPQGSRVGSSAYVGRAGAITDLPQVALQLTLGSAGSPNKSTMILRGMPDSIMVGGEYQPDPVFAGLVTTFRTLLLSSQFGFVGRDLAQASSRVLSASATDGVLLDGIPATGLIAGNWVRFNRTVDAAGLLISRPYQVQNVAGNVVRLVGWTSLITKPSGTLRRDVMTFVQYGNSFLRRATVKKVGAPFEKYRGRRSKKRRVSA